jgi:hypothetical protein
VSALAEALVAAQRRALAAMEKGYVAGHYDETELRLQLDAMGLSDSVDTDRLLVALAVIRDLGAAVPAETNGAPKPPDLASEAQWTLLRKLATERKLEPPEGPLTKPQAHEVIDSLKAGTYDPAKWSVPF